eukprot:CAMPEP_0179061378 /NCGR_PEP_ID=MMETSP0796-20121207/26365_1 /TAXON_ID=73915 /ORGANISM="Pyrodinium bahamense, Strain pbaha01" /LENGTH=94 /DNA_ID=CAMNT_0020758219 /DNA_START=32 /DNA_END=317 /DNA_ORIENTATION=+
MCPTSRTRSAEMAAPEHQICGDGRVVRGELQGREDGVLQVRAFTCVVAPDTTGAEVLEKRMKSFGFMSPFLASSSLLAALLSCGCKNVLALNVV